MGSRVNTDATGFYRLCGIPPGARGELRVVYGRNFTGRRAVELDAVGLRRYDLTMRIQ
jgi:hypothetical protein